MSLPSDAGCSPTRVLFDDDTIARIEPHLGGRVQTLVDQLTGRELLYQRVATGTTEFLDASTGGWDELFPNDTPFGEHPDHGRLWKAPFAVREQTDNSCTMQARLDDPRVLITRRYLLLGGGRRGLRIETEILAGAPCGPFMWTSHPMLAVASGWRVEASRRWRVDVDQPGRYAGAGRTLKAAPPSVPAPRAGFVECLYADDADHVTVSSPNGEAVTRVSWDHALLPHLWLVTVSGAAGIDLALVVEPSTSAQSRLELAGASTRSLATGGSARFWVEVESVDPVHRARPGSVHD